jgi:hypothetical protein
MAGVFVNESLSLNIILERIDPARDILRYYVLSIEPTLFCEIHADPTLGTHQRLWPGTSSVLRE